MLSVLWKLDRAERLAAELREGLLALQATAKWALLQKSGRPTIDLMSPVTSISFDLHWLTDAFSVKPNHMELTIGDFECVLEGSRLAAFPQLPIADPEDALASLQPLLAAWALQLEVDKGWRVEFLPAGSVVEDGGAKGREDTGVGLHGPLGFSGHLNAEVHTALPPPTQAYKPTPLVVMYLTRLRDVDAGNEKVSAAAYYLLTELKARFRGRPRAMEALSISRQLLDEIGRLASRGGNPSQSRKAAQRPGEPPLDDADLARLRQAMRLLVKRVAEVESGLGGLPLISMADLPPS